MRPYAETRGFVVNFALTVFNSLIRSFPSCIKDHTQRLTLLILDMCCQDPTGLGDQGDL